MENEPDTQDAPQHDSTESLEDSGPTKSAASQPHTLDEGEISQLTGKLGDTGLLPKDGPDLEAPDPKLGLTALQEAVLNKPSSTLAPGWEEKKDGLGRTYFVNHNYEISDWNGPETEKHRVIQSLLESGALVNASCLDGKSALHFAATYDDRLLILLLLKYGASIDHEASNNETALHIAIAHGANSVVDLLLQRGADKEHIANGKTALLLAEQMGNAGALSMLLDAGANPLAIDNEGWNALHHATTNGNLALVKRLLEANVDISRKGNTDGTTALHMAAQNGHTEIIKLLLSHGAEVDVCDEYGYRPLHFAALNDRFAASELLLKSAADPNSTDANEWTALHFSSIKGYTETAFVLLEHGADPNAVDSDGAVPLFYAAGKNHREMIRLLVCLGADVDATVEDGSTPLMVASRNAFSEAVEILLDNGANVNASDKIGWTALHYVAQLGHDETLRMLISKGADAMLKASEDRTALHNAALCGHAEAIQTLLDAGADVDAAMENGWRPLHYAAAEGHDAAVAVLVDRGAQMEERELQHQRTPLILGAVKDCNDVIDVLVEKGANTHASDDNSWTALHYAVARQNVTIVRSLLRSGASSFIDMQEGLHQRTAMYIAARVGNVEIINLLFEEGADLTIQNSEGRTPLEIATHEQKTEAVDLLTELLGHSTIAKSRDERGKLATPFVYDTLHLESQIRVLRLLPGTFNDPIQCKLVSTTLEEAPPYEPISYRWGDTSKKQMIVCNGNRFEITNSLFEALRRFRFQDRTRTVWADGICINQSSTVDKERQVSTMGLVYERGVRTLAWLGNPPRPIVSGIELMKRFSQHMESELENVNRSSYPSFGTFFGALPPLSLGHPLLADDHGWEAIREILSQPYFRRLWVQQEIGLSKEVIVHYGKDEVSMTEIGKFVIFSYGTLLALGNSTVGAQVGEIFNTLSSLWPTFAQNRSWFDDGRTLQNFKDFAASERKTLADIFLASRGFEATNAIDHIYGILGHPHARGKDGAVTLINVDYKRSVEETSVILGEQICLQSQDNPLTILCCVAHFNQPQVPSWVPLWHLRSKYGALGSRQGLDASLWKEERARSYAVREFSNPWPNRRLRVAILQIGKVVASTPPFPETISKTSELVKEAWNVYKSAAQLPESDHNYWHVFLGTLSMTYPSFEMLPADFLAFCRSHNSIIPLYERIEDHSWFLQAKERSSEASAERLASNLLAHSRNRKMFATDRQDVGTSLEPTSVGDVLAIVFGCPLPVLLKPTRVEGEYRLVGQAWVQKYAFGYAVEQWMAGKLKVKHKEIYLV